VNKFKNIYKVVLCLAFSCASIANSYAGSACEDTPVSAESFKNAMSAGELNYKKLTELNPEVAIIARVGSDLSEYNLKFSHLGFVWKDSKKNNEWRIVHLLNKCGTNTSSLWTEGLGNFFMDKPFNYDSRIIIPSIEIQKKLAKFLNSNNEIYKLHNSEYNMVSYAFGLKYQNSNQWGLENIAASISNDIKINTREQAQNWLKTAGYKPSDLRISALKRLGGRITKANIAFDDHPNELRFSDHIMTVTVDSVVNFMKDNNSQTKVYDVSFPIAK
jgi:hypothetical protein